MADIPSPYTPPPNRVSKPGKPTTRMAARLAPIPKVYDTEANKTKKVVAALAKKKPVPVRLAGAPPIDDQYVAHVYFSEAFGDNAGAVWSEPLEIEDRAAWASKEFYWKLEIQQNRVDPLLQGFQTQWQLLTPGWTFVDGLGLSIFDEAIANPLSIIRVIKAPGSIDVRPKFRVVVVAKYLP